jgi:hypothetical protein
MASRWEAVIKSICMCALRFNVGDHPQDGNGSEKGDRRDRRISKDSPLTRLPEGITRSRDDHLDFA